MKERRPKILCKVLFKSFEFWINSWIVVDSCIGVDQMAKHAPAVRKALLDATALLSVKGTTSREVVDYVKSKLPSVIVEDQSALIDLGLMVLAGRVAITKFEDDRQLNIFGEGAPNQFMKVGRQRIQTRSLTIAQWEALLSKPIRATNKAKTHSELISPIFKEMVAKGMSKDTTLGAYLDGR